MGECYRSLRMGCECAPDGRWVVLKVLDVLGMYCLDARRRIDFLRGVS
jgi:hypothetical protein